MSKGAWRQTEREVIDALIALKCGSSKSIGAKIGLSHKWVEDKLRILKAANRIYIADWQKFSNHGDWRRLYALRVTGEEVDMPKPKPKTGSQKTKDYRIRKRQRRMIHAIAGTV